MSNITEYLTSMQALTKKNLEILKGINQAFYTKSEHLSVNVDGEAYIIPSFLALEDRINTLQDNFENLVNAPKTGDAAFDFNGNTTTIEVKGFSNTPSKAMENVTEDQYTNFDYVKNQIFKDFCTPQPFVKIDLSTLPTDIQRVNVKKIVPQNADLIAMLKNAVGEHVNVPYEYRDIVKELFNYEKNVDYIEYDKTYELPVRGNLPYGEYNIEAINRNWTDNDLDEHYELVLDNLNYFTQNETIQNTIHAGDFLVTSNDKVKLEVEDVRISTRTVTIRIVNGAYADLTTYAENGQLGHLKYLPKQDWTTYKYLNLPLEEDRFVLVFIAPLERVSHIQAAWGTGLLFDVYNLKCDINGVTYYFKDYYEKFVNNVGDALTGITDMFDESLVNFTEENFNRLADNKPELDIDALKVVEINKHLSNAATIEEIYGLYEQKQSYKDELTRVQNEMDEINGILGILVFTDTTQSRTVYEQQLASLSARKKELTANMTSILQEIANAVNDTDTPIDNPKYHIRGFFNYSKMDKELADIKAHVIGIDVEYRYKNANRATGQATTITGNDIFSDWNRMDGIRNKRRAQFEGVTTGFSYEYEGDTTNLNEVSFNQIDIPITQGETVDIRLRVIYNIGQPFVEVTSQWSDIINIEFPIELKKNITVLDIIEENNNDIKKNQFTAVLDQYHVTEHTADTVVDQNLTFFHNPTHISSGFYTDERRVIPLFDKLQTMTGDIQALQDEILGTETDNLTVTLEDSSHTTTVQAYSHAVHDVTPYSDWTADDLDHNRVATEVVNLIIANTSNHVVKLYSIIPGQTTDDITTNSKTKYQITDYIQPGMAVYFVDSSRKNVDGTAGPNCLQHQIHNQALYFRLNSIYDNTVYYNGSDTYIADKIYGTTKVAGTVDDGQSTLYPTYKYMDNGNSIISELCIGSDNGGYYKLLQPGESIVVPLAFQYKLSSNGTTTWKTMSFDLRTSLYKDPINYSYTIRAHHTDALGSKIRKQSNTKFNPVIVKTQPVQVPANTTINTSTPLKSGLKIGR